MKTHKIIHSDKSVFKSPTVKNGIKKDSVECIAEETPIAMVFNGISHVVMMATPDNLEDFAKGFSISENIVSDIEEIYSIEVNRSDVGIEIDINISNEAFNKLKDKRRNLIGRTGCGLCGAESLNQVFNHHNSIQAITQQSVFSAKNISLALDHISKHQIIQQQTGATHAAALCNQDGKILFVREDVGRHNALDKLIGAFYNHDSLNIKNPFIIISSRASYEMIQKAATLKVALVVAISAPTALAVRLANKLGITLLGFARGKNYNIYTHKERIK
ncbi:MAG: formate dehydrogenase accessory sulfurtransferase FdhD [Methylophilaceae bacterium]